MTTTSSTQRAGTGRITFFVALAVFAQESTWNLYDSQVPPLLRPERYEPWVVKWGPPPHPLLWSHAMYLTLRSVMDR